MIRRDSTPALSDWQDAPAIFLRQVRMAKGAAASRLEVGQRFHRVGLPSVVWRVSRVYRDGQSVEHAILASNRRDLDNKTLSAVVLMDSRQYRLV
jgi:hypothetical protein